MANPFKAVGSTMADLWHSAGHTDCASPTMSRIGLILVSPLVVPVVFGMAAIQPKESVNK